MIQMKIITICLIKSSSVKLLNTGVPFVAIFFCFGNDRGTKFDKSITIRFRIGLIEERNVQSEAS